MNKTEWIKCLKFGLVGILNTLIDFLVFNLLLLLGGSPVLAKGISYTAGTVNSFFCNKKWTFQSTQKKRFVPFLLWNLAVLLLSIGCMHWISPKITDLLFNQFPLLANNLANLMIVCITMTVNFVGSRFLIFRD